MEAQDLTQDGNVGDTVSDDGVPEEQVQPQDSEVGSSGSHTQDPLYVQKRLKQQKRAHEREIRELHQRINDMQSQVNAQPQQSSTANPYMNQSMGNPMGAPQTGSMDEQIHKAVGFALAQKDMQERQAREAESKQHLAKQYGDLQRHLDHTADKYDDFEDVVRGDHAPFTPHMRDAALLLPKSGSGSAGEVLYKLGKNPDELNRISRLHPLDQASEMVKLSHALINGGDNKNSPSMPLGNIKSNPITNTRSITEKTPVSELRARMRAGWK